MSEQTSAITVAHRTLSTLQAQRVAATLHEFHDG